MLKSWSDLATPGSPVKERLTESPKRFFVSISMKDVDPVRKVERLNGFCTDLRLHHEICRCIGLVISVSSSTALSMSFYPSHYRLLPGCSQSFSCLIYTLECLFTIEWYGSDCADAICFTGKHPDDIFAVGENDDIFEVSVWIRAVSNGDVERHFHSV
jgi:hypothetical protein